MMEQYDKNVIYYKNTGDEQIVENYNISDGIMISRRERNRKKNPIGRKKGKRYKKKTNLLKTNIRLDVRNKYGIIIASSLVIGIYVVSHVYFKYHFYLGSTINCINVSGKSIKNAEESIKDGIDNYSLRLEGRNGEIVILEGRDFDLKYNPDKVDEIKNMKINQNKSFWLKSLLKDENKDGTNILVTYNEEDLNKLIDNLEFFNEENIIEPQNAKIVFENNDFHMKDEIYGNKVKKEVLIEEIQKSILSGQDVLNLKDADCYEEPEFTKSSEKVIKMQEVLNKYKNAKVAYNLGSNEEVIDMSTMAEWIDIDENYHENINEEKVRAFVDEFADKYDTVGKTRTFVGTSGRQVTVSGGDYGFKIDRNSEVEQLINDLNSKQMVQREPIYEQKGINNIVNDIEKTYVEIDLTNQHLWFYKDGNIITQGNVVSGSVANGSMTPEGTYKLKYKAKDSVLVGENYRSPVSFWMPFNGNIGLHDASWRSAFGGNIYVSSGSHGCVNLPYSLAKDIFYNIDEGMPIVCYY